jgi:hypothetical protein
VVLENRSTVPRSVRIHGWLRTGTREGRRAIAMHPTLLMLDADCVNRTLVVDLYNRKKNARLVSLSRSVATYKHKLL